MRAETVPRVRLPSPAFSCVRPRGFQPLYSLFSVTSLFLAVFSRSFS